MIKAKTIHSEFWFQRPATTSRGTYQSKKVHFIVLYHTEEPSIAGIGECSLFAGLSYDDVKGFDNKLNQTVERINQGNYLADTSLLEWPSINFALETAWRDIRSNGNRILYPSGFTEGIDTIRINGLIWMGSKEDMIRQVRQKLNDGFTCLKMKIGALDFDEELEVLKFIRNACTPDELEIRLDANGAFKPREALEIIKLLSEFDLHSIEQPIAAGRVDDMARICELSPVPIALDEEMIGLHNMASRIKMLNTIKPQYLVLKPGLLGGLAATREWISLARERNIHWWITSALET
ncbi:MAG: o-succinylbenzoate synthase, partial [Bacteroidales bacterium]|nr:o-succinylbenzoate synthase [Bacteroidales bacterium]